jgi:hypothetical protein
MVGGLTGGDGNCDSDGVDVGEEDSGSGFNAIGVAVVDVMAWFS